MRRSDAELAIYDMQAAQQRLDEYAALSHGQQAMAAVAVNGGPAFSHLEDLGRLAADVAVEASSQFSTTACCH
jgi:hypothetical protein